MPFFKDLRRRSKSSFRTSDSSTESSGTVPTAKSSSTLSSARGSTTPPSTYHANGSSSNVLATAKTNGDSPPPVPQRPSVMLPSSSNRNSMIVSWRACYIPPMTRLTKNRRCRHQVRMVQCEPLCLPLHTLPKSHQSWTALWYVEYTL